MKYLKQIWLSIWNNNEQPKTDHINKIMSIINTGHSTEMKIHIFQQVERMFIEQLRNQTIKNNETKSGINIDNETIEKFFSPFKAKNISVIGEDFLNPIKNEKFN